MHATTSSNDQHSPFSIHIYFCMHAKYNFELVVRTASVTHIMNQTQMLLLLSSVACR